MEAKSKIEEVQQMGFSVDDAVAIMRATGPRLLVQCVKWTKQIWDDYGHVLEGEDDPAEPQMIEWEEAGFGPQSTNEERANCAIAHEMGSLIEKMLGELPKQAEPLQSFLYGGIAIPFPSTSISDTGVILNGAIDVVYLLRKPAPSAESKAI